MHCGTTQHKWVYVPVRTAAAAAAAAAETVSDAPSRV